MAIRYDVTVDFDSSPRIITVESPSTEIIMQDLVDTLRYIEALPTSMDNPHLVAAAGKEALGGGVYVGITVILQNAKLAFQARAGPTFVQCNVSGGNLVAVDENGDDMDPIQTTAYVQVVRTSSSSATLQELLDIQYSSFNGGVTVDVTSSYSGTTYPVGTPRQPVNNISDAMSIADSRGFDTLYIIGDLTLTSGDDVEEMTIIGQNAVLTSITIDADANVNKITILDAYVSGTLDGSTLVERSVLGDINYINGFIFLCSITGTITLGGTSDLMILSSYCGTTTTPTVNCGGSGQSITISDYHGDINIVNKDGAGDIVNLNLSSGSVILADTVTAGTINCDGIGSLVDTNGDRILTGSWNGCTIVNNSINREAISFVIYEGTVVSATANSITLDANASPNDGAYDPSLIFIVSGTGAGQTRGIYEYNGTTKTAYIDRNWKVTPDTTSHFTITAWPGREHINEGKAQGGTSNTITLNPLASDEDDVYKWQSVFIRSGTGEDQIGVVHSYDGTSKIATMEEDWNVVPDSSSVYVMLPSHTHPPEEVWSVTGDFSVTGSIGQIITHALIKNADMSGDILRIYKDAGMTQVWKRFNLADNGRIEVV